MSKSKNLRPIMERLEDRWNPDGTGVELHYTPTDEGLVVNINATDFDDTIIATSTGTNLLISVTFDDGFGPRTENYELNLPFLNFVAQFFPTADGSFGKLVGLQIDGCGGNDFIDFSEDTLGATTTLPLIANGGDGNDTILGSVNPDTLTGGAGNDLIDGGNRNDVIDGGVGNDTITGGAGNDVIVGGPENVTGDDTDNDVIDGGTGDDFIDGAAGDDDLMGGEGHDTILGGNGNDTLDGGPGGDLLHGGDGDDLVIADGEDKELSGGEGNDTVDFGNSTIGVHYEGDFEKVIGSEFDDKLLNTNPNGVSIHGLGGDDFIQGNAGPDTLKGGEGNDTVSYHNVPAEDDGSNGVQIDLTDAEEKGDEIIVTGGFAPVVVIPGDPDVILQETISSFENLLGTPNDDTLTGDEHPNEIVGKGGNDTLTGNEGDDTLLGGEGNDILRGNANNDVLEGGAGNDNMAGGGGDDLMKGMEGNDILNGGNGNDTLRGGMDDDHLDGGNDNDDLRGGLGIDVVQGGKGNDTLGILFAEVEARVAEDQFGGPDADTFFVIGVYEEDAFFASAPDFGDATLPIQRLVIVDTPDTDPPVLQAINFVNGAALNANTSLANDYLTEFLQERGQTDFEPGSPDGDPELGEGIKFETEADLEMANQGLVFGVIYSDLNKNGLDDATEPS